MADSGAGTGGAPANYDGGQTIDVDPTALYEAGHDTVPAMLRSVSTAFKSIFDTWDGLKVSWTGDAADASQELKTQLDNIQDRLYGKDDQPGVIGQMASIAASAAVNYSNVEETNTKMFNDMNNSWDYQPLPPEDDDGGGSGDSGAAPSNDNWNYAPISETFS